MVCEDQLAFPDVEEVDTGSYPSNLHMIAVVEEAQEDGHYSSVQHHQTTVESSESTVRHGMVAFHHAPHYQNYCYHVQQLLEVLPRILHLHAFVEGSSTDRVGNLHILNRVADNPDVESAVHGVACCC